MWLLASKISKFQISFLHLRHRKMPTPIPDVAGDNPAAFTSATVLPTDYIIEILTRLPVKPLLRFKSVSKSFKILFSSTDFINHHLKRYKSTDNNNLRNQLLLVPSTSKLGYSSCTLESLYEIPPHPSFADLNDSPFLIAPDRKPYWLVGSCDGLVCVAVSKRSVALWNPSTRAFSTLPQLDDDDGKQGRRCYPVFGFGLDSLADDYKVVAVSCYPNKDARTVAAAAPSGVVQVYSMKSRVWKRIEDFKYGLPCNYPGKYVNNTLNFLMDNESSSIVSLDLHSSTYREITQPEDSKEDDTIISHHQKTMGVVEDCLCVMYHRHGEYSDLWVMKEFGVTESWTKLFRIEMRDHEELRWLQYFMPVHVYGGKALLWLWSSIAVYSFEDGCVVYRSSDGVWSCQVFMESLVSPEMENY